MKKRIILIVIILCLAASVLCVLKMTNRQEPITVITNLAISDVADKFAGNDFYLTVVLDDFVVEEYSLPYRELTLRTTESVYDEVVAGSGFVGITLEITPYGAYSQDAEGVGMMLKEQKTGNWKIIGITTNDNQVIQ